MPGIAANQSRKLFVGLASAVMLSFDLLKGIMAEANPKTINDSVEGGISHALLSFVGNGFSRDALRHTTKQGITAEAVSYRASDSGS